VAQDVLDFSSAGKVRRPEKTLKTHPEAKEEDEED